MRKKLKEVEGGWFAHFPTYMLFNGNICNKKDY